MTEDHHEYSAVPPRKCTACTEHSGLVRTYEIHGKILEKFDKYIDDQTHRTYQLMIGIIFCLLTGLVSVYFGYMGNRQPTPQGYSAYVNAVVAEDVRMWDF